MDASRHRIAYIDGLRAVAVLAVLAHHAIGYALYSPFSPIGRFAIYGARGVELFFVLSGFCLSYPVLRRFHEGHAAFDIKDYAAKRIVRIVPPYWIAIAFVVAFGLTLTHYGNPLPSSMHAGGMNPFAIIGQAFFMYADHSHIITDQFWTLPLEFSWYFVFPLLVIAWMRAPKSFFLIFGALAFFLFSGAIHSGSLPQYLPGFASGIVAADLSLRRKRFGPVGIVLLALFTVLAVETTAVSWSQGPNLFWQIAAFFFVVVCGEYAAHRALSVTPLVAIGIASYSIYLVHTPIVSAIDDHFRNPLLAGLVGLAVGFAFWALAERPFVSTKLRDTLLRAILRDRNGNPGGRVDSGVMVADLR